jgi:hypothetical protein
MVARGFRFSGSGSGFQVKFPVRGEPWSFCSTRTWRFHNVLQYDRHCETHDVTADAKRFLINTTKASDAAWSPPLTIVTNSTAAVKR